MSRWRIPAGLEVLANGLSLWQGAQVAVNTTFVSPVSRNGSARAGPDRVPGKAAADAGRLALSLSPVRVQ